ncbi:MAG: anaerobic ribonucleoside-triphosphate reductase activating protein [Planctomycetes bacterium]|nr:anaerobic ribonucleoside-triphosphate reductase activating protein [Planctomycetota bacterium]
MGKYEIDIRGFITNSMVEWENHLCAVVFTARCNWRCPYCHGAPFVTNPDSLAAFEPEQIFEHLAKQKSWLDGIAITGGEPTLQPGLVDFIRDLKATGTAVKLETNGTHPEVIEKLMEGDLLDCLAMDYKAPLDERLLEVTCVSEAATALELVKKSFALSRAAKIEREFHTTLCPSFINAEVLEEMAMKLDQPGALWVLQQYESDAEMLDPAKAGEKRFGVDEIEELARIAGKHHERVLLRKGKGS